MFVISNYIKRNLNINMWKVDVNYNSFFIEWQCYILMSLAQGSCAVATTSSGESRSRIMSTFQMLINMVAEGNVNVNNLVKIIVRHLAFEETNNSILTASNQEQSTNIVLTASAEIVERKGSISQLTFYRQLPDY